MKFLSKNFAVLLFCSAVLSSTSLAQVVTFVDFEGDQLGAYTNNAALQDFVPKTGAKKWYAMEQNGGRNASIIENGEHGKVLRLLYPKGCVGPNDEPTVACAGQVMNPLPMDVPADTMWVGYDVFFEEGFDFVQGGKLPGLCGGNCPTGGERPSIGDGWSARLMWRNNGKVVQYLYFVDQASTYGDNIPYNLNGTIPQKQFVPGQWHRVVSKITMNTVNVEGAGEKDGTIKTWFDGELVVDLDTMRWRDFNNVHIDIFYISTFHGGSDASWAPSVDSYAQFDNFEISLDSVAVVKKAEEPEQPSAIKNRGFGVNTQNSKFKAPSIFYKADGSKTERPPENRKPHQPVYFKK